MIRIMCMGAKANKSQCDHCGRLPRTPEDESGKRWLDFKEIASPCGFYLPQAITIIKEEEEYGKEAV